MGVGIQLAEISHDFPCLLVKGGAGHWEQGNPRLSGATGQRDEALLYVNGSIAPANDDQIAPKVRVSAGFTEGGGNDQDSGIERGSRQSLKGGELLMPGVDAASGTKPAIIPMHPV